MAGKRKTLHESMEELDEAVRGFKAALWEERWYFLTIAGILWVGLGLSILAFGPDWLG